MTLYLVTRWMKSGEIKASTHSEIRDAVERYNEVILHNPDVKYAYLSETWATFPNRGELHG
jgi:hypothetical protein